MTGVGPGGTTQVYATAVLGPVKSATAASAVAAAAPVSLKSSTGKVLATVVGRACRRPAAQATVTVKPAAALKGGYRAWACPRRAETGSRAPSRSSSAPRPRSCKLAVDAGEGSASSWPRPASRSGRGGVVRCLPIRPKVCPMSPWQIRLNAEREQPDGVSIGCPPRATMKRWSRRSSRSSTCATAASSATRRSRGRATARRRSSCSPRARAEGRLSEVDRECRAAALRDAAAAGLGAPFALFLNADAGALELDLPDLPHGSATLIMEITESALTERPEAVLRTLDARCARAAGASRSTTSAATRARWR